MALVARDAGARGADVAQRLFEDRPVAEGVAEPRLERGEVGPRRDQCTVLPMRSQRTVQGHCHTLRAEEPEVEKKMISARPTRLTKGT